MFNDFKITFRLNRDEVEKRMSEFDGTLLEFYDSLSAKM